MIRFLQKDNRIVKAIFIVIIGAAVITMVITLIPGIFQDTPAAADTYATVYPHWYSRVTFSGDKVSLTRVQEMAEQEAQRQGSRIPPQFMEQYVKMLMPQAGQRLIVQRVILDEAAHLGITATEEDVRNFIKTGQLGEYFFPNGQFVGEDKYKSIVYQLTGGLSIAEFEQEVHDQIIFRRLQDFITAGVTVSDQELRDQYRKQNIKIKFDYAVLSADDLRKDIKPSDADLQAWFSKNAARYSTAVPEERKISYFTFTADQVPGGAPKVTDAEIQAYYNQHQSEYQVPDESRSRHILIKFPGGAAKTDAEAKAKAEALLKQIQGGADFADLAKKNSEDPGSGAQGGELGFAKPKTMVPEFDTAIFNQKIGDIKIVKTEYGYHIIQVEERHTAHAQPIEEVKPAIQANLIRQKETQAEEAFATQLTTEAAKNGLAKTAAAHHAELVTTPSIPATGSIPALPDSTPIVTKAFQAKPGSAPQLASTGEGYAIFQVANITPAHAPSFADWKDHVATDYANERLPQLLAQKTKELSDKAKSLNDLTKAAKEVGATLKTSDLVGDGGQVPDVGQVGSVAPELFTLSPGAISGPISTQRSGIVAKLLDKQEPTTDEIAKNLDQTREQILDQRRQEVFGIFVSSTEDRYKKAKLIQLNPKVAQAPAPGLGE